MRALAVPWLILILVACDSEDDAAREEPAALKERLEAFIPEESPLGPPVAIEKRAEIVVKLRQAENEGVPHVFFGDEEIRPDLGKGVKRVPPPPEERTSEAIRAYDAKRAAFWDRYLKPKFDELQSRMRRAYEADASIPGQIDSGSSVRHEYVIATLNCFMAVGMTDVTFIGTPPPREPR